MAVQRAKELNDYQVRRIIESCANEAGVAMDHVAAADIICHRRDQLGAMLKAAVKDNLFPLLKNTFLT